MNITHSYPDITQWFFETLGGLLESQEIVTIGLAGGTSFDSWYSLLLLETVQWDTIDTSRIRWCVTDERVHCSIADRNDTHIWDVFLSQLCQKGWSQESHFLRPAMDSDGTEYNQKIGKINLAFFGIGPDGHTASLFPKHPALQSDEFGFIKIENAPKAPPERISLSPKSIRELTHACLFAMGVQKKEALANFLNESVNIEDCPAKILTPEIVLDLTS